MSLMQGKTYDALIEAGASPAKAQAAAEELAGYDKALADIRSDLRVLKWMVATLVTLQIALGVGNIWLTLNVLSRLPR